MTPNISLVDKIAHDLQAQIAKGKLQPGARVPPERSLCVHFGVGRTTVREALQSLIVRGVIVRRGRSVFVDHPHNAAPLRVDLPALAVQVNIKQLYEVRKLLEVPIAGYAALRATGKEIKTIRRVLESEATPPAAGSPHRGFHDALAAAVHNPALVQIYETSSHVFFRLPFFWQLFDDREIQVVRARRHEMARRWHLHIVKAIEQRDVDEAKGAMYQHLDLMEKDLLSRLHEREPNNGSKEIYSHPLLADTRNGPAAAKPKRARRETG